MVTLATRSSLSRRSLRHSSHRNGAAHPAVGESKLQSERQSERSENPSQDDIWQIQQVLQEKGFNVAPVDGKLGKKTKQALSQFQRKQGLQERGMPDAETLAALGIGDTHRAH